MRSRAGSSRVTGGSTNTGFAEAVTSKIHSTGIITRCTTLRRNRTPPGAGCSPAACAISWKNGMRIAEVVARHAGTSHHTKAGKGSSKNIHGKSNFHMMALDPVARDAHQGLDFERCYRADLFSGRVAHERQERAAAFIESSSCALEKRKPFITGQRRDAFSRSGSKRRAFDKRRDSGERGRSTLRIVQGHLDFCQLHQCHSPITLPLISTPT